MPVVGINIESIDAKKLDQIAGGVKVNSNTNLTNVKEEQIPGFGKKALIVQFEFITQYMSQAEKKVAEFLIGGNVLLVDDKHKEILESWKKDKKIPEEVGIQVINVIFNKCAKKAIMLSDDLQLPSPVPLPFAKKSE